MEINFDIFDGNFDLEEYLDAFKTKEEVEKSISTLKGGIFSS